LAFKPTRNSAPAPLTPLLEEHLTTGGKADPKEEEEGEETKDMMIERPKERIVMQGVVKELGG